MATGSSASVEAAMGGSSCSFDASSALLASRIDDSPTTLWIWDLSAMELRAVLIFSSDIASFRWHPVIPELLLVTCQGRDSDGVVFVWDPLSDGPQVLDCALRFPDEKISPKWQVRWIRSDTNPGVIYVGDSSRYVLASLVESDEAQPNWSDVHLSPSNGNISSIDHTVLSENIDGSLVDAEDDNLSGPDDTFNFKRL